MRTTAWRWSTASSTRWARSSSRASTRSRASAAARIPHVFTDRALRPGDPAYFDILHSYMGYRTCYYRTFAVASASRPLVDAYKRCRYYLDAAIDLHPPRRQHRGGRRGLPQRPGVRLPRRGGRLRAAVRPRRRADDLGEADLQPAGLARPPRGDPGGDGVRAGDVLARLATAGRRRGSRSRWWSPATAARSSPASPPRTWSSRASRTSPRAGAWRWSATPSQTATPSCDHDVKEAVPRTASSAETIPS